MIDTTKLKQNVDVVALGKRLNMNLTREGKILCPFHDDKTPSLQFYRDHAFCFACGKRADFIELIQQQMKCSFKEAVSYLASAVPFEFEHTVTQEERNPSSLRLNESTPKSFTECTKNKRFAERIFCLVSILQVLQKYTQEKILSGKIPLHISKWLENRGYNLKELLLNFSINNILFLPDEDKLAEIVKKENPNWKLSGLFKKEGALFWFSKNMYAIAFPVFTIFETNYGEKETILTSIRLRNIAEISANHPKDVELPLHSDLKEKGFPCSFGFMGLAYWSTKYPQVFDQCRGLNVVLTEGATDFLAGCLLFQYEAVTIILSAGSIAKSTQEHNLKLIKNCKRLILAFDNDSAGIQGREKVAQRAYEVGIKQVEFLPLLEVSGQDLNDILRTLNKRNNNR